MNVVIFIAYTGSQFTNSPGTFFRSAAQIPLHKMYTFVYRTFIKFILFCRGQAPDVSTEASVLVPKQMNLDYSAAGILLGNLLDNAIEACEKIEVSKRWITVNIIYKEHTLILKICNSKEIKKANIALSSKRHYKQSGIGIHSVTRVVEKYNGTIEFWDLDDSFEVSAILYGILSAEISCS